MGGAPYFRRGLANTHDITPGKIHNFFIAYTTYGNFYRVDHKFKSIQYGDFRLNAKFNSHQYFRLDGMLHSINYRMCETVG